MAIRKDRIWERLERIGSIGRRKEGGITRLAFSDEYFTAAERLIQLVKETVDCEVYTDRTGSVHIIQRGTGKCRMQIVTGSHLDTVPDGGLYDGLAGVITALEVLQSMQEDGIRLKHDLHLVAFNAEEAGPLGGTFSSRGLLGQIPLDGENARFALKQAEERLQEIPRLSEPFSEAGCFLELHIEQGGILNLEKISIGAVTGIFGIRRYGICVSGHSNHAGTTSMSQRADAMVKYHCLRQFKHLHSSRVSTLTLW